MIITHQNKTWRVAAVHGIGKHQWAWLVNPSRPSEQVRLSLNAPGMEEVPRRTLAPEALAAPLAA